MKNKVYKELYTKNFKLVNFCFVVYFLMTLDMILGRGGESSSLEEDESEDGEVDRLDVSFCRDWLCLFEVGCFSTLICFFCNVISWPSFWEAEVVVGGGEDLEGVLASSFTVAVLRSSFRDLLVRKNNYNQVADFFNFRSICDQL